MSETEKEMEALRAELKDVLRRVRVLWAIEDDEELEGLFLTCRVVGVDLVNAVAVAAVLTTVGKYLDIPWDNIPHIIFVRKAP